MSKEEMKSGWYLDARKTEWKISVIRLIREMLGCGLIEAKGLVDQAMVSPTLICTDLDLPNRNYASKPVTNEYWTENQDLKGAKLLFHGSKSSLISEQVDRVAPEISNQLEDCSYNVLIVLARFYGLKGRSRMNSTELKVRLLERLAYSEAVNPGIAEMMIKEAKWEVKRQKAKTK